MRQLLDVVIPRIPLYPRPTLFRHIKTMKIKLLRGYYLPSWLFKNNAYRNISFVVVTLAFIHPENGPHGAFF